MKKKNKLTKISPIALKLLMEFLKCDFYKNTKHNEIERQSISLKYSYNILGSKNC